ncbi:MAG: hypothetical protein LH702_16740, partial [Phormidesmis sp. CAN_BIN44]|nr:hypothetical protein [Phormidesmis sp. CAN_BIN44]
VDGIPEVLEDGKAGLLVPPRDAAALSNVLTQLMSDPAQLQVWKERATNNLGWLAVKRVHQETVEVYHDAIQGNLRGESLTMPKR